MVSGDKKQWLYRIILGPGQAPAKWWNCHGLSPLWKCATRARAKSGVFQVNRRFCRRNGIKANFADGWKDGCWLAGWKSPKINCETTCQPTGWLIIAQRVLCSWYRQSNRVDTSAFIYTEQLVYSNRIIVISHRIGAKSKNYYMSWPRSNLQVNQL